MKVEINGTEYEYLSNIRENDSIRNNFMEFIYTSFGFNFRQWYNEGYWTEKYEPHVLVKDNQVVSTVTVNHMKYLWGQEKTYIQIGGVLTREAYYRKGLSRWLMNHIVEEYKEKCDQIFLFSDDVAVAFYPKMGFTKAIEYIGKYNWRRSDCNIEGGQLFDVRKLNIANPCDRNILLECYQHSNPFSVFPSVDCEELVVFYGLEFKKDCYYYFKELNLVVVAELRTDELMIDDLYGTWEETTEKVVEKNKMNLLDTLIYNILKLNNYSANEINVTLGFSPIEELTKIKLEPLIQEDDTTFLLADKENIFNQHKLRFPILSHN